MKHNSHHIIGGFQLIDHSYRGINISANNTFRLNLSAMVHCFSLTTNQPIVPFSLAFQPREQAEEGGLGVPSTNIGLAYLLLYEQILLIDKCIQIFGDTESK